jgi:predicted PurR-regulated permease PerM
MRDGTSARRALLVLLLGALVAVYFVFKPLGSALFLAGVLAMVLYPLHRGLSRRLRGKESVAAGLLTTGVLLLLMGPLVGLAAYLVAQAADATVFVQGVLRSEGLNGLLTRLPDGIEGSARDLLARLPGGSMEGLADQVQGSAAGAGGAAASAVGTAVSTTGSLIFQTVMMLLALFFFLTNKEAILNWVDASSPLRRGQTRELLTEFRNVCRAVIMSSVVTALVQAAAALVGYFIARVPAPIFFGAVTFVVAFIPAVGAASVVLVAAALMFLTGHPVAAIFLAAWGVLVVGLVDNVVKPLLMKTGMQMHGAVVFFALLGGLSAFGGIGLLLGPLAVALFLSLLRIYQRDYAADPSDRAQMRRQGVGDPEARPTAVLPNNANQGGLHS